LPRGVWHPPSGFNDPVDALKLLEELVAIPGPPGQERLVREALVRHLDKLGLKHRTDAKGNLLVGSEKPKVVVTAHMDEIAMIVRRVEPDGRLAIGPLGGLFPWKLGEGPVQILCEPALDGVLSFGSIHTADKASNVRKADSAPIDWDMVRVVTGLPADELVSEGVRPGTRVVVHPSRRAVTSIGTLIGSYFLDDRADLVVWLLALGELKSLDDVLFIATTSEEVGGEGALYALRQCQPEVCVALELGPNASDAPIELSDQPTVWATDSYATMSSADGDLVSDLAIQLGMSLQFQALTRGGSDASCAASLGLCARPITLGLPLDNSHGFEVMHPGAMAELTRLTVALVRKLVK
jgi:putative aminopeptidase FrvX